MVEVRFHEFRQGSKGSTEFTRSLRGFHHRKVPQAFHKCSSMVPSVCRGGKQRAARRLKSHRSSKLTAQDRLVRGRNTKQNRKQSAQLDCVDLLTGADNTRKGFGFVANQVRFLRDSICSRVNAWHYLLLLGGLWD